MLRHLLMSTHFDGVHSGYLVIPCQLANLGEEWIRILRSLGIYGGNFYRVILQSIK